MFDMCRSPLTELHAASELRAAAHFPLADRRKGGGGLARKRGWGSLWGRSIAPSSDCAGSGAATAHVGRLRVLPMFSTAISASALVQYNSAADRAVANVRFRYNPREGDDLYLVWSLPGATNARWS